MAEVSFSIAGRSYTMACGAGEEAHLAAVAKRVDAEAQTLNASGGALSEARLMLMTALILADKLDEAEATPAAPPEAESALSDEDAGILAAAMDDVSERLAALATPSQDTGAQADTATGNDENDGDSTGG